MRESKRLVLGVVFLLVVFSGASLGASLEKNISMQAGPTLPGEQLALLWVETVVSPRNLGRGEGLLLSANLASRVESVLVSFDDGQKINLTSSNNGITWKGHFKLLADAPLGIQTAKFEIKDKNNKTIVRNLDFFVNLGQAALLGDGDRDGKLSSWPVQVLKSGKVVWSDEKDQISAVPVSEGEQIQGLEKTPWYKVLLNDGRQGWIEASYVKEPVEDYQVCAYEYYKIKDFVSAANYCRKALEIDQKFVKARFWLAKSLLRMDQENEALAELVKIFEIDSGNKDARLLADSLSQRYLASSAHDFKTANYQGAIAGYNNFLKLNPNDLQVSLDLGKSYRANGQEDKAHEVWNQVLAVEPGNDAAIALLGGKQTTALAKENTGRSFGGERAKADKEEFVVLVSNGKTYKGTKITEALNSVMSMTKSLGTSVLERGWSVKPADRGYKVSFLCEYGQQGKGQKLAVESFDWNVDKMTQKILPSNKNAKLLMARW